MRGRVGEWPVPVGWPATAAATRRASGKTAAVAGGVAEVDIGTALDQALTGTLREYLDAPPDAVDPRTYLRTGREAMSRTVERIVAGMRLTPA